MERWAIWHQAKDRCNSLSCMRTSNSKSLQAYTLDGGTTTLWSGSPQKSQLLRMCSTSIHHSRERRCSQVHLWSPWAKQRSMKTIPNAKDPRSNVETQRIPMLKLTQSQHGVISKYPNSQNDSYTIVLPWGKYKCQRLPMGLSSKPDIFQEKFQLSWAIWNVSEHVPMQRVVEGFHHRVVCQLAGMQPHHTSEGEWQCPPLEGALMEAGLFLSPSA